MVGRCEEVVELMGGEMEGEDAAESEGERTSGKFDECGWEERRGKEEEGKEK